jgi:short-subunit dehydrogenase
MENNSCSSQYIRELKHNDFENNNIFSSAACFHYGNIEEASSEDWSHAFNVNVRGYALMAIHIVPVMKKQHSGSIVNIASTLGLIAIPNAVPYSVTKRCCYSTDTKSCS